MVYLRSVDPRPRQPAPGDLRASDADRERVVDILREAAGDGRLTLEEHTERVERAYSARTLGELAELTKDLVHPSGDPASPFTRHPVDVRQRPAVAVFGQDERRGRWVVPARQPAIAVFGSVRLDLREALLQRRHVVIQASAVFGSVEVLVPEGVEVRMNGAAIFGSKSNRVRTPPVPDAPVIEINALALFGSVEAKTPKRKRRLWGLGGHDERALDKY